MLCAKAGRNTAIFELPPEESVARAGAQAGVVQCRWTFGASASAAGLVVELATELLKSEAMARLAIEATRLPENHRGKTIEALPKMGDGGNLLTTVENGKLRFVEIEAVKGRQRFLMTVRPNVPGDLGYRVPGQSINFLGIGLQRL